MALGGNFAAKSPDPFPLAETFATKGHDKPS